MGKIISKPASSKRSRDRVSRTRPHSRTDLLSNSRDSVITRGTDADAHQPASEVAPTGLHPRHPDRDQHGRFAVGNNGRLVHGATSEQRALALAPLRQETVRAILGDLGFDDESDAPRALTLVVAQLVEARFIAQSYFEFLAASGGVITSKGRQRRAVDGYLKAADRVGKFASMIGLERRARSVGETPAEWLMRTSTDHHLTDADTASQHEEGGEL